MLVGAFALSLRERDQVSAGVRSGMQAFSVLFGLLVGVFGGLGYTATEVYLDTCAEWMPLALDAEREREGEAAKGRGQLRLDGGGAPPPLAAAAAAVAAAGTPKEAEAAAAAAAAAALRPPPPPSSLPPPPPPPPPSLPPPGEPSPSPAAAELAAATALRHKFVASRYKNLFASHIYAFVEVGTVSFVSLFFLLFRSLSLL